MAKVPRSKRRSKKEGLFLEEEAITSRKSKKKEAALRRRKLILGGVTLLIVFLLLSTYYFFQIIGTIEEPEPTLVIIDAVGTKPEPTSDILILVKISLRNQGERSMEMEDITLTWKGPGVDTDLHFNSADPGTGTKDSFGTGGVGSSSDGWDPGNGVFKVKGGTISWVLVDLTSEDGIDDLLKAGDTLTVTIKIGGKAQEVSFKVPNDLGSGKFVPFSMLE